MPATARAAHTTTAVRSQGPARATGAALTAGPAAAVTRPTPRHPRPGSRPRRPEAVSVPLGSLTQRDHRPHAACRTCGSAHVTRLSMSLTDGTPVDFTSCHRCEHRTWEHAGSELSVDGVLDRTRRELTGPRR